MYFYMLYFTRSRSISYYAVTTTQEMDLPMPHTKAHAHGLIEQKHSIEEDMCNLGHYYSC